MGSLSQPRLNIFTVGNMRVMICLGQGGLRSLSASSYYLFITSLAKEVMFLVALVSLSVCLFVCLFVCLSVDNITKMSK